MSTMREALEERILVGDGAMGTQLMAAGLEQGTPGEVWNLEAPEKVVAVQRRYVEAGSDCLITNTFSGNGVALGRHGMGAEVERVNRSAAEIARQAFAECGREGFVIGDVGPVGGMLEMWGGDLSEEEVRDGVSAQVVALVEAGVNAIIVETQTDLEEAAIGVEAAKAAGAPLVICSFAYDVSADGSAVHTMMGVRPAGAAERLLELGVDVVAFNCGTGLDMGMAAEVVRVFQRGGAKWTMAQPNAGVPELVDGRTVYRQTPEQMAAALPAVLDAGVSIVGACCGSTPEHIAALRKVVDARTG
jgi:5-methyltetrahydrofolate--homocysteine methyltransferase